MTYRGWMQIGAITLITASVAVTAQQLPQRNPGHPPSYAVVDLGTLGGTFSFGGGINEEGWVNGESTLSGDQFQHAFLWRDGVMVDLLTLGGPNSASGYALNDAGVVAGGSEISALNPLGYQFCDFDGFTDAPPSRLSSVPLEERSDDPASAAWGSVWK